MAVTAEGGRVGARPLRDCLYGDLLWTRPGILRRELLLEAGSEQLAALRWEKPMSFEAVGESADGRWLIGRHRSGSLRGQVLVRDAASQALVATFTRTWRGTGTVRFATGAEYGWGRQGFWRPWFFWSSAVQERLVAYTSRSGWHRRYLMEVDPGAHRLEELPVLVLLGAYLMVMISRQSSAH